MDAYVDQFQKAGGSMVMLAKGNRSAAVTNACQDNGGFYLGSIGGPAARLAKDNIRKVEVLDFPELGMEAVWRIEVRGLPRLRRRRRQGQRLLRRDLEADDHVASRWARRAWPTGRTTAPRHQWCERPERTSAVVHRATP